MSVSELLLISPPDYQTREFRGAQPLGIAYLASMLRDTAGIECQLLDANAGGALSLDDTTAQLVRFIDASLAAGGHPIVGFSAVSQVMETCGELADRVKAHHPGTLVIIGGYHPTFAHQEILRDFPAVDLCVRGEGEHTLLDIMLRWQDFWRSSSQPEPSPTGPDWSGIQGVTWRKDHGGEIVVNPSRANIADLDGVPFPARDLLPPLTGYPPYADTVAGKLRVKASIMSSRGCPFHCSFCSIITFYGDAGGKPWRGRSVDNVVAEMVELADRFGASHFEFQDDNFFVQPQRALAIVEAFANSKRSPQKAGGQQAGLRDFSFAFLTRADQIVRGERFFPALRRAGLRYVSVGIESGSEASLERLVKQTSVETNRRALQILHEHDVAAQVEFIMFEPGTTVDDLQANLRFIEEQGLFGYFPPLVFGHLLLLPGTPVRSQMESELGLGGSIHDTLAYAFPDPRVAQVSGLLAEFQNKLGDAWYELAFSLLDSIPALELAQQAHGAAEDPAAIVGRNGNRNLPVLLAQLKLEFFALTRIPYGLLRAALGLVAEEKPLPIGPLLSKAETELQLATQRVHHLQAELGHQGLLR